MKLFCSFAALAVACLVAGNAQAAVVALYEFSSVATSSDTETVTTASSFASSTALTPVVVSAQDIYWGHNATTMTAPTDLASGLASSLAAATYLEFTVTIPGTHKLSLTSLDFDWKTVGGYRNTLVLVSDKTSTLGSETIAEALYSAYDHDGGYQVEHRNVTEVVDLSTTTALQNMTGTSVTFRFDVADGASSGPFDRFNAFDDITLNGTVALVPEPSSFALAGLSLVGLIGSVRRRRNRA